MSTRHFIAMDTHGKTTDICCKTRVNARELRWHVATTIPALREVLESIARPRQLTFEEGPLADWLYRELKGSVDEAMVCDPRRNGLIAKDGDKDDPIDAGKLCDLYCGGYLRAVYHGDSLERAVFKRQVGLYHERVVHRVSESNKIIGRLKCFGVVVKEKSFEEEKDRAALLEMVGSAPELEVIKEQLRMLWKGYDMAVEQETCLRRQVLAAARNQELIVRLMELPGVGWIRAATLMAYLDTPWRFKSKSALWKYLGIGLVRERSGEGREWVHVERACNHRLKSMILGAADTAIRQGDNPFARQHALWVKGGLSPRNARRNVARSMAAVMWGMWKNGGVYDPDRVGLAAGSSPATAAVNG
jgi:transposase